MYEVKKAVDHNFILANMKVGDTFLGCKPCAYQLPVNIIGVGQCPNCLEKFKEYTVTETDIYA